MENKWAIIGTSWISMQYYDALIKSNQKVSTIITRTASNAESFILKDKNLKISSKLEATNDYNCVYIGSPNFKHGTDALQALQLGNHVMIEKPISHDLNLTQEIFNLGEDLNLKVMEGYIHINQKHWNKYKINYTNTTLKTNFMQTSSKIKANTYNNANSFKKDSYGGVITDLGVYPISLAVMLFGKVISWDIFDVKKLNEVVIECQIVLNFENNNVSSFKISKLEDGDNAVYLNDTKISEHITFSPDSNPMISEIKQFNNFDNYNQNKFVSINTNQVITQMKKYFNEDI